MRSSPRRVRAASGLLAASVLTSSAAFGWELTLEAPPSLGAAAQRIRSIDAEQLARILWRAGLELPPTVRVTLVPEDDERARAVPRWIVGQAFGARDVMILPERVRPIPTTHWNRRAARSCAPGALCSRRWTPSAAVVSRRRGGVGRNGVGLQGRSLADARGGERSSRCRRDPPVPVECAPQDRCGLPAGGRARGRLAAQARRGDAGCHRRPRGARDDVLTRVRAGNRRDPGRCCGRGVGCLPAVDELAVVRDPQGKRVDRDSGPGVCRLFRPPPAAGTPPPAVGRRGQVGPTGFN